MSSIVSPGWKGPAPPAWELSVLPPQGPPPSSDQSCVCETDCKWPTGHKESLNDLESRMKILPWCLKHNALYWRLYRTENSFLETKMEQVPVLGNQSTNRKWGPGRPCLQGEEWARWNCPMRQWDIGWGGGTFRAQAVTWPRTWALPCVGGCFFRFCLFV